MKLEKNEATSLKKMNIDAGKVNIDKTKNKTDKTTENQTEKTNKDADPDDNNKDAFNFEDLLMNLTDYKSKAAELEFDDRKKFAEDIVLKFWNAIGGDKEEIEGLADL